MLCVVGWVFAASPQRLSTPVTDDAGALTGKVADVEAALNDLQDATGTQLWVWFTDTLSGQDPPAFATETARLSDLGPNDLLLVIALDDRAYGYWKGDSVKISDAALGDILSRDLEAGLRSGDDAGAIVRTAQALTTEMRGGATPAPITPGEPTREWLGRFGGRRLPRIRESSQPVSPWSAGGSSPAGGDVPASDRARRALPVTRTRISAT